MKPVQVMLDEELLKALDADPEVRARGRSAVLRRAAAEYLERKRRSEIAEGYRRAYGESGSNAMPDDDLAGWEDEGEWPNE